jgi:dTDP-4-amino-4,6-dideoxy-D-galactose acyltransferase
MGIDPVFPMKKRILFRCDGGNIPEIGTGHVIRCLLLARELTQNPGTDVLFLMRDDTVGSRKVRSEGFPVNLIPPQGDEAAATLKAIMQFNPDVVVIDSLNVPSDDLALIKRTGVILIALDYIGEGKKFTDFTINPIFATGENPYEGYDYMVLPPVSGRTIPSEITRKKPQKVFVSFGGYDKADLTLKFLASLNGAKNTCEYHVVVGQLYDQFDRLKQRYHQRQDVHLYQDPPDFSGLLQQAELAVVSGGLTMFQAAASEVPCLVVAQYPHQLENARKLERLGAVESAGLAQDIDFSDVQKRLQRLISDPDRRKQMADTGGTLFDGRGIARVTQLIGIVDRLDWDSRFFNFNIAYLYPKRLTEDIVQFCLKECREENIDCLYYLCDCHDPESVRLAEKHGFHFVDMRLTFTLGLLNREKLEAPNSVVIRQAQTKDVLALEVLAAENYTYSRYFFDGRFPEESCRRFYSDWVSKSVRGKFDHVVFCAQVGGGIAGFITCSKVSSHRGWIGLLGIDQKSQGKSLGKALIGKALEWFRDQGLTSIEAVTQGRNIQAQRLYQSCGFQTEKTELWYHKWF